MCDSTTRDLTARWFDYWLKGERHGVLDDTPKVQFYTMGSNEWQSSDSWPPGSARWSPGISTAAARPTVSSATARLATAPPTSRRRTDGFTYDPTVPVPSLGGGVCCTGEAVSPGSFDQRGNEARSDVLVYTSEPLEEAVEITGTIGVDALCRLRRQGHRLHRQVGRCLPRRHGLQHRRDHPAGPLP